MGESPTGAVTVRLPAVVHDAHYPAEWEADVVAADGGTVHLRPITADDADAVVDFHSQLSERTRYYRYFSPYPEIPERDLRRFVEVDHRDTVALVLTLGSEILAIGRYVRLTQKEAEPEDPDAAEVAFVVRDDHQGRGLGSILLEHLAAVARERGVTRFVAEVLAENRRMARVFRDAGYEVSRLLEGTTLHLEFDVASTPRSVEVQRSREQRAEARSVANVLYPRSVAVVGASQDESKIGHVLLADLLRYEFTGPIYPVHPDAGSIRGVRAYPSVLDVPDDIDLVVLALPAAQVLEVVAACLTKKVRALVVVASGFGETGSAGLAAQRQLVRDARAGGMRVVGPSALGVINLDPAVSLNASLAPSLPGRGRVGFFCQSGALGIQILDTAARRGLGLSTFVSAGNRADLSGNDLMQYWDTDPGTDVVLLYLETFGNPRKFARVARRLARQKPVVAVKSGRHAAVPPGLLGVGAPVDEDAVGAVFDQAGVIRVDSVDELFDVALLLAHQPLPSGPRVGVVGNSSALGMLAADALLSHGLYLSRPPTDLVTMAGPEALAAATTEALDDDGCDAVVVVFMPPVTTEAAQPVAHAEALAAAVRGAERRAAAKPVLTTFLAAEGVPASLAVAPDRPGGAPQRGSIPSYPSPERAVLALARAVRYTQWRERPVGDFVVPAGVDPAAARRLVDELDPGPGTALSDEQADALLRCVGIVVAPFRRVQSADDAVEAARDLGGAVVLKTADRRWRARTDLRGVHVGLTDPDGIRAAYAQLVELSGSSEVYVQTQAPPGIPCVVEVRDDPSFGSLVSFGLAGVVTELLGDRAYRAPPLSTVDAATLVRAPRAAPLLDGYRGARPVDLAAMEDLVLRVGVLAERVPEVRSLVLDPVLAADHGAHPTGVSMVLGPPPGPVAPVDAGPRRLA